MWPHPPVHTPGFQVGGNPSEVSHTHTVAVVVWLKGEGLMMSLKRRISTGTFDSEAFRKKPKINTRKTYLHIITTSGDLLE